ncbi:MAG: DEAD/DEAH box helicase [Promethearchaeota archaeon]
MISVSKSSEYISHPLIKDNTVIRRHYQENIFVNCLNYNCLVVIPTGLGKTIIALMLAVHRLTTKKGSKVFFLAPTKPLVEQHYNSFLKLTKIPPEELKSITGSIPPSKRKQLWEETTIAFITPQVLQNDIISGICNLRDVSLIIFDECHRAVGEYAYCFIAKKYIESSRYPQILGLTASPGSTEEKINEIKENLFINHIEIRTEKDSDVRPYIYNVDNQWIKVDLPKEFLEIKKILEEQLKGYYKFLKEIEILTSFDISKITRKDLLKANKAINSKISYINTPDLKDKFFKAKKFVANALRLSHMLELIETQGIVALTKYIEKIEDQIKQNSANKSLKELYSEKFFKKIKNLSNVIISNGIIHPKLEVLDKLLRNQIKENKNSRILVFCQFRDTVNQLVNYFKDDELVKGHKFVGQAKKTRDKGLSQKDQVRLLEEFREGIYNVLFATSVAEEGLDIAECDLVIFYDVVPSAIRSIQRRGRTGRKKEGKVYILMAKGTRDEGYYWAEKVKERKMKDSLIKMKIMENSTKSNQPNLLDFINKKNNTKKIIKKIADDEISNKKEKDKEVFEKKSENSIQYTIVCDTRESASPVIKNLSLLGINIELKKLAVGDYIISERTAIERKTAKDFGDSLKDGRLFNELYSLKENYERPILILEGNPFSEGNFNENALYGAISSIILNLGVMIYRTSDPNETSKFLYHLAKKEQGEYKKRIKLRSEKAPLEMSRLLEYIISGIPGVNASRAKSLLRDLKTLQNIFNSDIPDLLNVENIGKKLAQEIYKISRYKYKEQE